MARGSKQRYRAQLAELQEQLEAERELKHGWEANANTFDQLLDEARAERDHAAKRVSKLARELSKAERRIKELEVPHLTPLHQPFVTNHGLIAWPTGFAMDDDHRLFKWVGDKWQLQAEDGKTSYVAGFAVVQDIESWEREHPPADRGFGPSHQRAYEGVYASDVARDLLRRMGFPPPSEFGPKPHFAHGGEVLADASVLDTES